MTMILYCFAKVWEGIAILSLCAVFFFPETFVKLCMVSIIAGWLAVLNTILYKRTDYAKRKEAEWRKQEMEEFKEMLEEYKNKEK